MIALLIIPKTHIYYFYCFKETWQYVVIVTLLDVHFTKIFLCRKISTYSKNFPLTIIQRLVCIIFKIIFKSLLAVSSIRFDDDVL